MNAAVLFFSGMFEVYAVAIPSITLGMLLYPVIVVAGLLRARQGDKEALVFTFAWMLLVTGMVMQTLRDLGHVPHNYVTYFLPRYAKFFEMITILFAMGTRVRRLRRQKKAIEKNYTQTFKQSAEKEAQIDGLTNIYNRRYLIEMASAKYASAAANGEILGLLMFDIDLFKQINDDYGHAAGDQALCEFALLLGGSDEADTRQTAERIKNAIASLVVRTDEAEFSITTSIGAIIINPATSFEGNLKSADVALYNAKNNGRNQVLFISQTHPPNNGPSPFLA